MNIKCFIFKTMKNHKMLIQIISVVISFGAMIYAFWGIEWKVFFDSLKEIRVVWYAIAIILILFSIWFRALRWRLLLEPIGDFKINPLFKSTMIGNFGNNVLPFRLGEVLRAYSGAKLLDSSTSTLFSTIVVERFIEMVSFFLLLLLVSLFLPLPAWVGQTRLLLLIVVIVMIVGLVLLYFNNKRIYHFLADKDNRVAKIGLEILNGLVSFFSLKHYLVITAMSFALWLLYAVHYYAGLESMNIQVGFSGAMIVMVMSTFSVSIPSAPGFIGTYHSALIIILMALGIDKSAALPFAIMIHLAGFIPITIWGLVYYIQAEISWRNVRKESA